MALQLYRSLSFEALLRMPLANGKGGPVPQFVLATGMPYSTALFDMAESSFPYHKHEDTYEW